MKRVDPSQPPVLSVCLIARNCEATIETTLKSVRERAPNAEIVVVDTLSSDRTPEIAQRYADVWEEYRGPRGDWTRDMYAFDDAAAARNRSFELGKGKFLLWIDTDDRLPDGKEATRLLKINNAWRNSTRGVLIDDKEEIPLEDALVWFDKKRPDVEVIWSPYLYRKSKDSSEVADIWQVRERIIRNNGLWHWVRPAHEILVPKDSHAAKGIGYLPLLFVHEKKHSPESEFYSLKRHYEILIREYEAGERSSLSLLYLENFSRFLCPERRGEFIKEWYENSHLPLDRMRCLIRAGEYAAENGFYMDAMENLAAATHLRPDLPDAWITGAKILTNAEDWMRAAEWWAKGARAAPNNVDSEIAPRAQTVECRVHASLCLRRAAWNLANQGALPEAIGLAEQATTFSEEALKHPAVQMIENDKSSATSLCQLIANDLDGFRCVKNLHDLWKHLVANDETIKATKILEVVPHHVRDLPQVVEIERGAKKVQQHVSDPVAYREFYATEGGVEEHGGKPSEEKGLTYEDTEPRGRFLIDWLKARGQGASVLDVGSWDGNIGIPVLTNCPQVYYTAVEAYPQALDRFVKRAAERGVNNRLDARHGFTDDLDNLLEGKKFDAVLFFEVIEHVPDPIKTLRLLLSYVKPDGRLFLSTPWGSFDKGAPANLEVRDPRGHVRAMTPRDLVEAVEAAGARVAELGGTQGSFGFGATMHAAVEKVSYTGKPISFFVPSALWDWNATKVIETGMGASEETIVYLSRELAKTRKAQVYGPLPEGLGLLTAEEVVDSVQFWPREQRRRIPKDATIIVSRSPSSGPALKDELGDVDMILWLQDAWYPDLNPETAKVYRKIVVLSEWHKNIMHRMHDVPLDKMVVIPNFLLAEHFINKPERQKHRFVYCSSPDRGLIELLKMWPKIKSRFDDAELDIYYGWEGCMKLGVSSPEWNSRFRKIRTEYLQLCHQPGVSARGRVNHASIALEMQKSDAWAYPTLFSETFCSNAVKSRAAGCVPVCTPIAALVESASCPQTVYVQEAEPFELWVDQFVEGLARACETTDAEREKMSKEAIEQYRVEAVLPKWLALLR